MRLSVQALPCLSLAGAWARTPPRFDVDAESDEVFGCKEFNRNRCKRKLALP